MELKGIAYGDYVWLYLAEITNWRALVTKVMDILEFLYQLSWYCFSRRAAFPWLSNY
jgi:hypothetical protein